MNEFVKISTVETKLGTKKLQEYRKQHWHNNILRWVDDISSSRHNAVNII